ncbi:MAG: hypothetical protein HYS25_01075 [Ignavibacteriales bacterium]|nr:hypothetical protein [Ignavibacteriales bacterium]
MKYGWIKEIPEYEKYFTTDQRDSIELIGFEAYMVLHERFEKTSIHFSSAPIMMLKKAWAIKNKHIPYNQAARILGVSEKTIYNWREEKNLDNYNLFDGKK